MALPPGLEQFMRLPIWNALFLLMAVAVAIYSSLALRKTRRRQDLYYLLLGLYLVIVQTPIVVSGLLAPPGQALAPSSPAMGFLLAMPAIVLFILGIRARE